MTDATATPALQRVPVVCVKCGATSAIWITDEEIAAMGFEWSPLDQAYKHTCGRCLYQRVDADAPASKQTRRADPERSAHSRRKSGGLHTQTWHNGDCGGY